MGDRHRCHCLRSLRVTGFVPFDARGEARQPQRVQHLHSTTGPWLLSLQKGQN
jgi:hypothetical protein